MQGLLDCEKNRNAIHQLQKFLINGQKHGFKPKADDRWYYSSGSSCCSCSADTDNNTAVWLWVALAESKDITK